jgi:hypothetical protein
MELLHRYGGLKVSVVYRVPDDLIDLNGFELFERATARCRAVWRFR